MHTTVYVSCVGLALATLPEIQCVHVYTHRSTVYMYYTHTHRSTVYMYYTHTHRSTVYMYYTHTHRSTVYMYYTHTHRSTVYMYYTHTHRSTVYMYYTHTHRSTVYMYYTHTHRSSKANVQVTVVDINNNVPMFLTNGTSTLTADVIEEGAPPLNVITFQVCTA